MAVKMLRLPAEAAVATGEPSRPDKLPRYNRRRGDSLLTHSSEPPESKETRSPQSARDAAAPVS